MNQTVEAVSLSEIVPDVRFVNTSLHVGLYCSCRVYVFAMLLLFSLSCLVSLMSQGNDI